MSLKARRYLILLMLAPATLSSCSESKYPAIRLPDDWYRQCFSDSQPARISEFNEYFAVPKEYLINRESK